VPASGSAQQSSVENLRFEELSIGVVCRQNQVRSIIVSEFIRQRYKPKTVFSAGVEANAGSLIPERVVIIAKFWGIPISTGFSRNIRDAQQELNVSDLVISVDDKLSEKLLAFGIPSAKLCTLNTSSGERFLLPRDPVEMNDIEFRNQLSKCILLTTDIFKKLQPSLNQVDLKLITPNKPTSMPAVREMAVELAKKENAIIVNLSTLQSKQILDSIHGLPIKKFRNCLEATRELTRNSGLESCEIQFEFEIIHLEREILFGAVWQLISTLPKFRKVILIAPPLRADKHESDASILMQIYCDNTRRTFI